MTKREFFTGSALAKGMKALNSWVVFDIPTDMSTIFPAAASGSPRLFRSMTRPERSRAESWEDGLKLEPPG
jgi:hypothetical protein